MNYYHLEKEALGRMCRRCINRVYDVKLSPNDCRYLHYPYPCRCCGQMKHIVAYILPVSRWKIWFSKKGR